MITIKMGLHTNAEKIHDLVIILMHSFDIVPHICNDLSEVLDVCIGCRLTCDLRNV